MRQIRRKRWKFPITEFAKGLAENTSVQFWYTHYLYTHCIYTPAYGVSQVTEVEGCWCCQYSHKQKMLKRKQQKKCKVMKKDWLLISKHFWNETRQTIRTTHKNTSHSKHYYLHIMTDPTIHFLVHARSVPNHKWHSSDLLRDSASAAKTYLDANKSQTLKQTREQNKENQDHYQYNTRCKEAKRQTIIISKI